MYDTRHCYNAAFGIFMSLSISLCVGKSKKPGVKKVQGKSEAASQTYVRATKNFDIG